MRGKNNNEELLDNIVALKEHKVPDSAIIKMLNTSSANISRVMQAYRAAQNGDLETVRAIAQHSSTIGKFIGNKFGIDLSTKVAEERADAPQQTKKEQKLDNTATAFAALLEAVRGLTEAVDAIDKRLAAMQLTQSGMRSELVDKLGKVVEAVNVNGDIITKEHNRMSDILGGIKQNTKKRQWQGVQE